MQQQEILVSVGFPTNLALYWGHKKGRICNAATLITWLHVTKIRHETPHSHQQ